MLPDAAVPALSLIYLPLKCQARWNSSAPVGLNVSWNTAPEPTFRTGAQTGKHKKRCDLGSRTSAMLNTWLPQRSGPWSSYSIRSNRTCLWPDISLYVHFHAPTPYRITRKTDNCGIRKQGHSIRHYRGERVLFLFVTEVEMFASCGQRFQSERDFQCRHLLSRYWPKLRQNF